MEDNIEKTVEDTSVNYDGLIDDAKKKKAYEKLVRLTVSALIFALIIPFTLVFFNNLIFESDITYLQGLLFSYICKIAFYNAGDKLNLDYK